MFGHDEGLDSLHKVRKTREMIRIGRAVGRERQSDAMHRDRVRAPERIQHREARTALDHVVLGMDLVPHAGRRTGQRLREILGLEAQSGGRFHDGGSGVSVRTGSRRATPCPSAS